MSIFINFLQHKMEWWQNNYGDPQFLLLQNFPSNVSTIHRKFEQCLPGGFSIKLLLVKVVPKRQNKG